MQSQRIRLDEVTLMRCALALLIVFMHSFTCYNGSWRAPKGHIDVTLYKWLARVSFACTLEAFVFISGYLFSFQRTLLKKVVTWKSLILSKFKRLILPSLIFSSLYFAIFYEFNGWGKMIYSIVNGCGHMWFLPMLFWCFITCWLLLKIKCKDIYIVVFLVFLNIIPIPSLPLRISNAFSFLLYFYFGYLLFQHREKIAERISIKKLVLIWILAIFCFVIFRPIRDLCVIDGSMVIWQKIAFNLFDHISHLIYATTGLFALYYTSLFYVKNHNLKTFTITLAGCCFGIYIFQQFVLQFLYYKTSFPILVGPFNLPWCGFIIATVISFGLSFLFIRTKVGRFLIG